MTLPKYFLLGQSSPALIQGSGFLSNSRKCFWNTVYVLLSLSIRNYVPHPQNHQGEIESRGERGTTKMAVDSFLCLWCLVQRLVILRVNYAFFYKRKYDLRRVKENVQIYSANKQRKENVELHWYLPQILKKSYVASLYLEFPHCKQ